VVIENPLFSLIILGGRFDHGKLSPEIIRVSVDEFKKLPVISISEPLGYLLGGDPPIPGLTNDLFRDLRSRLFLVRLVPFILPLVERLFIEE